MSAPAKIQTPFGIECRKRDAIQAVQARFYLEWHRIVADRDQAIRKIEREGV